ncbi:MAG: VCBS repeat-containing protein [Deltaproteobacteria bacterium]|nr:VCBS repeat-containing protein [Deltaproteobacteria bacterium]
MKWTAVVTMAIGLAFATGCPKEQTGDEDIEAEDEPKATKKGNQQAAGTQASAKGSAETKAGTIKPARLGAGTPFQSIDQAEAERRLGPKMKPGSKIAHHVFEGPFGPSPKSLFAVTKRTNGTFYVLVMGDDGKAWPAGPLADPELNTAAEVTAVSFFDANGDGTTDALVMATYHGPRGGKARNINVALKWTDQGMRRLLKLEPKIESLSSAAAVRQALAP